MVNSRRIALVTPWYGRDQLGGAERLAWDLSHALVRAGAQVDVLTTCCRSFHDDWGANYFRPGTSADNGVTIHRFKVDSRDRAAFARANARLLALPHEALRRDGEPLDERASRAFFTDNITSRALLGHLRERGASYDAVLFTPYLYGTTVDGLELVADRAFLVPCLHDEAYAYLGRVRDLFDRARALLFNSQGEAEVAAAMYGPAIWSKSSVIGHAVDAVSPASPGLSIGGFTPQRARYVLALGRQDRTKNTDFLIEAFGRFRQQQRTSSLQLVLAGPRPASLQKAGGVIALGAVREDAKGALLRCARALAQPSTNESFSRAMYEAWSVGRPVIAHSDCWATARAVEEAEGGWTGATLADWVRIFTEIDEAADEAIDQRGARGQAAARENGSWDDVAARVLAAVDRFSGTAGANVKIDQLIPLGDRDATRYANVLDRALRTMGVDSAIHVAESGAIRDGARSIAHVTMSVCPDADIAIVHAVPDTWSGRYAALFATDAKVHDDLASRQRRARILPEPVDPAVWSQRLDRNPYADGRWTLVSIAPLDVVAAERLTDILVILSGVSRSIRMIVHADDADDGARAAMERDRRELDLADMLVLTEGDRAARFAALRAASVAFALGAPVLAPATVIEPLWFDVPVVAFDDPITSNIVESCGVIVESEDPHRLAAILRVIGAPGAFSTAMRAEGRRVRERHAPFATVCAVLESLDIPLHSPYPATRV
jgi:glycosyltransferase involved in cell wall biosynthesis